MNLILLFIFLCFLGNKENVKQEYCFNKDNIQFKMTVNNYKVTAKDTLGVAIEVINESDFSIYVVPTFYFTYIIDSLKNTPNGIYLDYGGGIGRNISEVPFIEIKPKEVKSIEKSFICDNFRYDKFSNEIYFSLWLGYIKPESKIDTLKQLNNGKLYFNDNYKNYLKKYLVGSIKIQFIK